MRASEKKKEALERVRPSADAFAAREQKEKEKEKGGKEGEGWRGHYGYRRRPIHHELPTRTTTGTCGSGDIRVLHADDVNGGAWCGFAGAGDTSIVQDLNVRVANLRTRAVMTKVIILVERIKLLRKCHLRR